MAYGVNKDHGKCRGIKVTAVNRMDGIEAKPSYNILTGLDTDRQYGPQPTHS